MQLDIDRILAQKSVQGFSKLLVCQQRQVARIGTQAVGRCHDLQLLLGKEKMDPCLVFVKLYPTSQVGTTLPAQQQPLRGLRQRLGGTC